MKHEINERRRRLLKNMALGVALAPLARVGLQAARAADAPLVTADNSTAKALKYVSDAKDSPDAKPGSTCATCKLYQGAPGSAQGGCALFPEKSVKAAGWCVSWTTK